MKKPILLIIFIGFILAINAQEASIKQTLTDPQHNVLLDATARFGITQTGCAKLELVRLFDGDFEPSYTPGAPTNACPTVIQIEGLPIKYTPENSRVGWLSKDWQSKRFKIEGYDDLGMNLWKEIVDYSSKDYPGGKKFSVKLPAGQRYTKLRFTFYTASGTDGRLGLSELFFIRPDDVRSEKTPEIVKNKTEEYWSKNGTAVFYSEGNVGIGTVDPGPWKLEVNGEMKAQEIKVKTNWADFVFDDDYILEPLMEVEKYIDENKHLKNIPSAKEVRDDGIYLGRMNAKLLQKIEELTLYTIAQEKRIEQLENNNYNLEHKNNALIMLAKEVDFLKREVNKMKAN